MEISSTVKGRYMRFAIISDIHSNLEALYAVISDISKQKVNTILCLGDVVGYGPHPKGCLELVRREASIILKGNHEDCVCYPEDLDKKLNPLAAEGVRFSIKRLNNDDVSFLKTLPMTHVYTEYDLSISHGTFTDPDKWNYIESPEDAQRDLEGITTKICLIGHTHMPFVFGSEQGLYEELVDNFLLKNEKYLINVGSVGQPRDGDCRASYGILDYKDATITYTLRRIFYNIAKTEGAMKALRRPLRLSERLFRGE